MCFCIATAYGKGVYFAKAFSYSAKSAYSPPDKYKGKYVIQCGVLTGHYCVGRPGLVEPPVRDKNTMSLYDSVVDDDINPSVFVVFQDHQVYPEYLVTFYK